MGFCIAIVPSIAAGSRMPCQWMLVGSGSEFLNLMMTRSPTLASMNGPGIDPSNVHTGVGGEVPYVFMASRASRLTSTMFGSGFSSRTGTSASGSGSPLVTAGGSDEQPR